MQLSKENLKKIDPQPELSLPGEQLFELPEKVLQFGTGVLLRGLPDYFIDKANKQGIFNGRVVVVKSTSKGGTDSFEKQDGLYTICVRGIEENKKIEENSINAAISRVLSASDDWKEILKCAHDPEMQLIISNTTEVGIVLTYDDITSAPPHSFPGKLLAFLYERYKAFNGNEESGMVIVPTELIVNNGDKLKEIVFQLALQNKLENDFIEWLGSANHFCNSLVDRIVPGALPKAEQKATEEKLGYSDELMIMAESFRLWAIESGNKKVKDVLSFSKADDGVVVTPDIEKFRELKLRLLNGTHTFSCGIAMLAGFKTVKDALQDEEVSLFIRRLMMLEIADVIDGETISYNEACAFADKVMDRFRNPFLDHKWKDISVNYSSKMKMRNLPLLQKYFNKHQNIPQHMALGFAAYIAFMKCRQEDDGKYYGDVNGETYLIDDSAASFFAEQWNKNDISELINQVLANTSLWGADLSGQKDFAKTIKENLLLIQNEGVLTAIERRHLQKTTV